MKNTPLYFLVLALGVIGFYACQKENSGTGNPDAPAKFTVYLTDHQTPVFDSVFIDLQRLEVKLEDDSLPNDGWVSLSIVPGVYNILRFRNGLDTLFATGTLPNGRVKKIRLTLGTQNSVMKDGQRFPLKVKDNDRQVTINISSENFDVPAPGEVRFWIDFDAARSIRVDNSGSGNNNGYELKAQIKAFTKSKSGRIEGRVLPDATDAVVLAINGTDTATAIPEREGEFKIMGLNSGTYTVIIDGNNGYRDTTISNVVVRRGEDTHLPTITLRQ